MVAPLYDVHCHLDSAQFESDYDKVIKRAEQAGVKIIISNGTDPLSNRKVLELAKKYPIVKAALGFYPVDALQFDVDKEIEFIKSQKDNIIAIGEVGIDYHWVKDPAEQEKERENFRKALALAKELDKPIIVHSRSAEKDTLDLIEESGYQRVNLHCFAGNKKLIQRAFDMGLYISIPPNVVRSDHFARIAKTGPLKQLLLETDSPYLAPEKEGRNEPKNVVLAVEKMAELRGMDPVEIRNLLFMNFQRLFLEN